MNKRFLIALFIFTITFSQSSQADAIYSILNAIHNLEALESSIDKSQIGMLKSQLDVEGLMKQLNEGMTSHGGWGTYLSHDYQSYGDSARSWTDVMRLAEGGGGSGALGQSMSSLANQFPIDKQAFNKGISNPTSQKYYVLQSQTVLAARTASQLDYDKIHDQIAYQQMLQKQIEKTADLKGAVDLNNRIQVEANLINLEILRQAALSNQQHAISDQANINSALLNAKFLTKS